MSDALFGSIRSGARSDPAAGQRRATLAVVARKQWGIAWRPVAPADRGGKATNDRSERWSRDRGGPLDGQDGSAAASERQPRARALSLGQGHRKSKRDRFEPHLNLMALLLAWSGAQGVRPYVRRAAKAASAAASPGAGTGSGFSPAA
jgi:hypothetical protein